MHENRFDFEAALARIEQAPDAEKRPLALTILQDIQHRAANVKRQLDEAAANVRVNGEYSDPRWWSSARAAQRFYGSCMQKVQAIIGTLPKTSRPRVNSSITENFVDIARERLETLVFDSMMTEAKRRAER